MPATLTPAERADELCHAIQGTIAMMATALRAKGMQMDMRETIAELRELAALAAGEETNEKTLYA